MDPRHRAWITAALLAAGGMGVAYLLGGLAAAIPLWVAAAGVLILVSESSTPPELPSQVLAGDQQALARLTADLELTGRGIHRPPADGQRRASLFLPAQEANAAELPPPSSTAVIHRERPGVLGLSLPPPGQGLETAWHKAHGLPAGQGIEEATQHLRKALSQLGLARDVSVARTEDRVRVSYTHTTLGPICEASRVALAPWDVQGGCPVCSFIALLIAHAMDRPIAYRASRSSGEAEVELELEVLG